MVEIFQVGKFINGVPWGLVLGSLFLVIYINDVQ